MIFRFYIQLKGNLHSTNLVIMAKTYFDLPEMKNLNGPIIELAKFKEKQELIQKVVSDLRYYDPNESDFWLLTEFIGHGIYYNENSDEKEAGNCPWIHRGGPNYGRTCNKKQKEGSLYCHFHANVPNRPQPDDVKKIMCELLGLKNN